MSDDTQAAAPATPSDAADLAAARAEVDQLSGYLADRDAQIAALTAANEAMRETERLRIATELDHEASVTPCAEDATVARNLAALVRANFSYDEADRQSAALAQSSAGEVASDE